MAIAIKKAVLWRKEVENRPGALASALAPLAAAGANLKLVVGYRLPGDGTRGAIEVYPVSGKKAVAAAENAGLDASALPTLLVEGDDKPGLGHALASALGEAGINVVYAMAQVVGKKYGAVLVFENEADAARAGGLLKKASAAKRR